MATIGVFSSYEPIVYPERPSRTFCGLVEGLSTRGLMPGRDVELLPMHSNDLDQHFYVAEQWLRDRRINLAFVGGTPVAWKVRQAMLSAGVSVPLVYFGAHPIDGVHEVGMHSLAGKDTVCVRMQLPLTYNHRTFRIVRTLFPQVERISIAFARNTIFCHRDMADRYDRIRRKHGSSNWAECDEVGFRSIRDLCWVIDCAYREYPLCDADEFAVALRSFRPREFGEPVRDVLISFNDVFHVKGASDALLEFADTTRIPLIWVNNSAMVRRGAVADFCNRFEATAAQTARYVVEFVRGTRPHSEYEWVWNEDLHFTLNRTLAQQTGIPQCNWDVAARAFHEIL